MSEEIHLSPEELERISKAIGNFGSKIQALVDIAKILEGIIAFFESPAWGNVQKIITDSYNVNEKLLNGYDLTPDYTNVVKNLASTSFLLFQAEKSGEKWLQFTPPPVESNCNLMRN